ncbi:hypothetical protein TELCIR_07448 [Teladorsagia circumcincta]|uniref:Uncharacterized protein n=1 Tax=Teladorsagia circumcincta TaxID=45464 RepID=A0A2G9UKB4_TELCI|nr:hypothetical protein TELCIR_07448 [Teladorsagia circumcincta]
MGFPPYNPPPYIPPYKPPTQPPYIPTLPPYRPPTQPPYIPPYIPPYKPTQPPYIPPYIPPYKPPTQPPYIPTLPPYKPPPYYTTQRPYWPTTTGCYPYSSPPCYVATNKDMQAAISSTASLTSSLASSGKDYSSTNLLRQISTALQSLQYQSYDQVTLVMLSPAISKMKTTTASASYYCKQQPISYAAMTNLSQNLVWWTNNGYNPTPQQVQNLFNTASQFLEQYC